MPIVILYDGEPSSFDFDDAIFELQFAKHHARILENDRLVTEVRRDELDDELEVRMETFKDAFLKLNTKKDGEKGTKGGGTKEIDSTRKDQGPRRPDY